MSAKHSICSFTSINNTWDSCQYVQHAEILELGILAQPICINASPVIELFVLEAPSFILEWSEKNPKWSFSSHQINAYIQTERRWMRHRFKRLQPFRPSRDKFRFKLPTGQSWKWNHFRFCFRARSVWTSFFTHPKSKFPPCQKNSPCSQTKGRKL